MACWLEVLGTYDFEIQHRAGVSHGNADGLSRRPCQECGYCSRQEQKDTSSTPPPRSQVSVATDTNDLQISTTVESFQVAALGQQREEEQGQETGGDHDWPTEEELAWSTEYLRQLQMEDSDILPLIQWKEKGTRPSWQDVAALSGNVKSLWSQWQKLDMKGGVLYRR